MIAIKFIKTPGIRLLAVLIVLLTSHLTACSQNQKAIYKQAFAEQLLMLKGQKPINFKRAVFITENAYSNGQFNYQSFCNEITATGQRLKEMIRSKGISGFKTAGNWAAFNYMMEPLPENNYKPFAYDFDDFMARKDWQKMFVTKLMKSRNGNCHSLPHYYKILCEEVGASASLALAPNHIYIKHKDEKGQWTNVELTNGGFPRDQWIIKEMAISVEAIKNEIYMTPLSQKESIALVMFDLACGYKRLFGSDNFVLNITNTALSYFPKCIPLLQEKANITHELIQKERKKVHPDKQTILLNISSYKKTIARIDALGYKDMPQELYQQWVQSVEKAKQKIANN